MPSSHSECRKQKRLLAVNQQKNIEQQTNLIKQKQNNKIIKKK